MLPEDVQEFNLRLKQEAKLLRQAVKDERALNRTDFDVLVSRELRRMPPGWNRTAILEALYRDHGRTIFSTVNDNRYRTGGRLRSWCSTNKVDSFTGVPPGRRPKKRGPGRPKKSGSGRHGKARP
jgi:predicted DCC family thiol-disulfide oxidoreductase YuxK